MKQRTRKLLERVGLSDRLGHPPARLSDSKQQRIAIAHALVNHPQLLEPTGNLGPKTGFEVLEVLRDVQRSGSQTLLLITYDLELAALEDRR